MFDAGADRALPFSCVPEIAWPGLPTAQGAAALAMQFQLERSQWWSPEQLLGQQFRQLRELARHALAATPHYRDHLARAGLDSVDALDESTYLRWPVLKKSEVQRAGGALHAARFPAAHGEATEICTTGSTGEPTRVRRSGIALSFGQALVLRDHLWHRRDFGAKFAVMRSRLARETVPDWWSVETNVAFRTGSLATISTLTDVARQFDWIEAERPAYLLTYPTVLRGLLDVSRRSGRTPQGLRQVITFTEMLPADLREQVARLWQAELADVYSCEEFGPIALQCPQCSHYHVQAEHLYVEFLREDDSPCAPGEMGRVVITSLLNFAMPLLRYDLGDYAVPGAPCACGRGLPVIERITGRVRNLARTPDGRRFRPFIPFGGWLEIAPIRRLQLVQRTLREIELRYEMERELSAGESARLAGMLREQLGFPFDIVPRRVERIERVAGGKFEDFISELDHR